MANCPKCRRELSILNHVERGVIVDCPLCGHRFRHGSSTPSAAAARDPLGPSGFDFDSFSAGTTLPPIRKKQANAALVPLLVLGGIGGACLLVFGIVALVLLTMPGTKPTDPALADADTLQADDSGTDGRLFRPASTQRQNPGLGDVGGMMNVREQDYLQYDWQRLAGYDCHFQMTVQADNRIDHIHGTNQFTPTQMDPSTVLRNAGEKPEQSGSGTGFLVHPDGVIVTCAHVVEGAIEMEIVLDDGRRFQAEAIALDRRNDLALLKVSGKGLPTIPLANSDDVPLAEEIRAVGFPLSDVLGESIKVTRGEVSGKIERKGQQLLQIDASVNPGNSGGPVVDGRGNVVGITHAMMTSDDISDIGLAIPSKFAVDLLKKKGIPSYGQLGTDSMSGPEVMKKVQPATVFIKVKTGPGGVGSSAPLVLRFQGGMGTVTTEVGRTAVPSINTRETGNLIIDDFGQITHNAGEHRLPIMMGQLGGVGLEPFPIDGSRKWDSIQFNIITINTTALLPGGSTGGLIHTPYGPRLGPRLALPPQQVKLARHVPVIQLVQYEIVSETSEVVRIKKTYNLTSVHEEGLPTLMEMEGTGTLIFSKRDKVPQSMDFTATMTIHDGTNDKKFPVTLKYEFKPSGQARPTLAADGGSGTRQAYTPGQQPPSENAQASAFGGGQPVVTGSGTGAQAAPVELPPVRKVDEALNTEDPWKTGPIQGLSRFDPNQ